MISAQASIQFSFGPAGFETTTVNGGGVVRKTYTYPPGLTPARARSRALALLLAAAEKLGAPHLATAPPISGEVIALRLRTGTASYSIALTGNNGQSVALVPDRPYATGTTVRAMRTQAFAIYRDAVASLLA